MAVTLNASTSSGFIATSDTSGVLELQNNGTTRMTVNSSGVSFAAQPLIGGVAPPAFSAYVSGAQTVNAGTNTKIQFNTENFDTANCYDNTTNYRFTPNVAGYYLFNIQVQVNTSYTAGQVSVRKNGTSDYYGIYTTFSGVNAAAGFNGSVLLFMNGTTDYVEGWAAFSTTQAINTGGIWSYFQGVLVRGA